MSTMSTIKFPGDSVAREIVDKLARTYIGDLNALTTTEQADLVAAINEVKLLSEIGSGGGEEGNAKAIFIDLSGDICDYTLAQLQTFVNEQQIIIGTVGSIQIPFIDIDANRALFSVTFEAVERFVMIEYSINSDQTISENRFTFPKIPVPSKSDTGKFLQVQDSNSVDWVVSSATVEVDKTLSLPGVPADAASVGNALNTISNISKVTEINLSSWDDGEFSVTLLNGAVINFTVQFDETTGAPSSITDDNGLTTIITW